MFDLLRSEVLRILCFSHRLIAKTSNRKLVTTIPRNETVRPRMQFLHSCTVSLSDLYITTPSDRLFCCIKISGPIVGIYKSLTDT
jgi:hypothetical protein